MSTVPEREEIDAEYKWSIESIFESDEAWETAYDEVSDRLEELRAYEGEVADDPETLSEFLALREAVMREVATVTTYASLRSNEDTRDQTYQAMAGKADQLSSEAASATSFLEPALQSLTAETVAEYVEAVPDLAAYEHYLDDVLRMKPHTRSPEVEELLADLSEVLSTPSDAFGMLSDADMSFPTVEGPDGEAVELSQGNFTKLQKHPDREFRRETYEAFYDEWADVRNTVGTTLKQSVKKDVKTARARNYDTARQAALDGPNVPVAVYDTLVDTVEDNLGYLQRHADLKAEAVGVDRPAMHDLYVSLTGEEGPEVSYEQATEWVIEAVAPLGEAYQSRMAEGLESRWVDVYESRGKRSGAYSAGVYDTQPFIMMNYQDDISSLYTLAHELGHSMHSELASEAQPWQYADYEIFVAEVASTVNETLLTHHLLETVEDDALRRHVLDEYLERFRSTLFRQTMFASFEQAIHERVEHGEPLTPDVFDRLYGERKRAYYANADVDDRIEREWMRIPHFYYNFYVYQYSTGISSAVAVVDDILAEGEPAAERYLDALGMGGSAYPVDILRRAGVDPTEPDYLETALSTYGDYLDRMASLAGLD